MLLDLHSHSVASDGLLSPSALVAAAGRAGVEALALTDHDTTAGLREAAAAAPAAGLQLVPGIELSVHHEGHELHVLAYFAPARIDAWEAFQARRLAARWERLHAMIERLEALGAPIDRGALLAEREGAEGVPGRPHVARALVAAGHVPDLDQAFERFLANGRPAHVPTRGPSAAEALALVRDLPGLSVLAHPIYGDLDPLLEGLTELGLDGVEAYHFTHEPEVAAHYQRRARDLGLLVTGGSDYHGDADDPTGARAGERLGRVALPPAAGEAFLAGLAARTGWAPRG
ncbi:MAG: PHP domain-containing protein [Planctomycetota bacterium]